MSNVYFTRNGRDYMITADRSAGYEVGTNPHTGKVERILKTSEAFDAWDANNERWRATYFLVWPTIHYSYTDIDGRQFSCSAPTLEDARELRREWERS